MRFVDQKRCIAHVKVLCEKFVRKSNRPRLVFGINEYADSIAGAIDVDGFIDDFTSEEYYLGKPIFKTEYAPKEAIVVSVVIGRPLTAEKRLIAASIENIDYFSFSKYSGLAVLPVKFWSDFNVDYVENKHKYEWVRELLFDDVSKDIYDRLINFRLTGCLDYMRDFSDRQVNQYFEDFLDLSESSEVFVDVGGFDGFTSEEFIKRCPEYNAIHLFEPEEGNLSSAKRRLENYKSIYYYQIGLSDASRKVRFSVGGSVSAVSDDGECEIRTNKLDDVVNGPVSFIKMDIEGGESAALAGAKQTIINSHPKIAICVYHKYCDFWSIPEQILSYRDDYSIYLRHYTEGVDETVMFFVPN